MSDNVERDKSIDPEMKQKDVGSESYGSNDDIYSDDDHEFDAKKVVSVLAKMICTFEVDPQMVATTAFTKFSNVLNPRFEVDIPAIVTECLTIFRKEKAKLKEKWGSFDGESKT